MQTADIETYISNFLAENFLYGRKEAIHSEQPLLGNVIDSTGVMELVMFLQERFGITVDDEEVNTDNLNSVKQTAAFVQQKIQSRSN